MSLHTRKTRRTLARARAPPPRSGFARNVAAGEKRSALTTHSTSLLASSQSRSAQIVFLNQPCNSNEREETSFTQWANERRMFALY